MGAAAGVARAAVVRVRQQKVRGIAPPARGCAPGAWPEQVGCGRVARRVCGRRGGAGGGLVLQAQWRRAPGWTHHVAAASRHCRRRVLNPAGLRRLPAASAGSNAEVVATQAQGSCTHAPAALLAQTRPRMPADDPLSTLLRGLRDCQPPAALASHLKCPPRYPSCGSYVRRARKHLQRR
jgi:hypothetical protein